MNPIKNAVLFNLYLIGASLLFTLAAVKKKGRSTHTVGIGAAGTLKIVDNPAFPDHDFFQAGATFPIQIRHASVTFPDDAAKDLRSASIRFAALDEESPLDILMNTGPRTFRHLEEFWNFTLASVRGKQPDELTSSTGLKAYCEKEPVFKEIFAETMRRAPESLAQVYYYSKLVNFFRAKDGKVRYVKYRLVPEDRGVDSGVPTGLDNQQPWNQERSPEETRSPTYLRDEYRERVARKPIIFHLQLRLHDGIEGDTNGRINGDRSEIFTQEKDWSEDTSPWLDLATLSIDRMLTDGETEKLSFNVGRQPVSLGAVTGYSARDPNSINAARILIYKFSKAARGWVGTRSAT